MTCFVNGRHALNPLSRDGKRQQSQTAGGCWIQGRPLQNDSHVDSSTQQVLIDAASVSLLISDVHTHTPGRVFKKREFSISSWKMCIMNMCIMASKCFCSIINLYFTSVFYECFEVPRVLRGCVFYQKLSDLIIGLLCLRTSFIASPDFKRTSSLEFSRGLVKNGNWLRKLCEEKWLGWLYSYKKLPFGMIVVFYSGMRSPLGLLKILVYLFFFFLNARGHVHIHVRKRESERVSTPSSGIWPHCSDFFSFHPVRDRARACMLAVFFKLMGPALNPGWLCSL